MTTKNENVKDIDFSTSAVPQSQRRSFLTMFMIMLGFTFFSASMWVGQQMADGLDFGGFLGALILGGIILSFYTGTLAYVAA
ncbi:MAG: cytosine permease, partial [Erysipelotrichaceae bacterium]|nr:cytosine permease [Erysipelotrichaceae bacterium]